MADFLPFNASTHTRIELEDDYNNILKHGLEKPSNYLFRVNGSYYEALLGSTATDCGTIAFGGADNAGSADGTDADAVYQAAIDDLESDGFGSIHTKKGDYTFNTGVIVEDAMIDLTFEPGAYINYTNTSGACIKIDTENLSSTNLYKTPMLKIDGPAILLSVADTQGIWLYRSSHVLIDRPMIRTTVAAGVEPIGIYILGTCFGTQVTRAKLYGGGPYGIGVKLIDDGSGHPNNTRIGECRAIDSFTTGIEVSGGGHLIIENNIIQSDTTGLDINYGAVRVTNNWLEGHTTAIDIVNALATDTFVEHNRFQGNGTDIGATTSFIRPFANDNYVTENHGTSSILNGTTSIAIAHGLAVTPLAQDINVVGLENPTNDVGTVWVDTIGAANFTVNCEADPGASNWDIGWRIDVHRVSP
jgi:hypothetical protein